MAIRTRKLHRIVLKLQNAYEQNPQAKVILDQIDQQMAENDYQNVSIQFDKLAQLLVEMKSP